MRLNDVNYMNDVTFCGPWEALLSSWFCNKAMKKLNVLLKMIPDHDDDDDGDDDGDGDGENEN